ncbi:hypothetical protein BCE_5589 [Bacillus cereus ATCC 10987]|uniref:Uncharacterized protein n=1 Tax=Bacillus cereus (strain ATCC 10987 / NRS 248) TaxID=222523 RepID=Q72WY9_BACC1|nr:hypothetical protein BCE_5589 [Bacillus cereus ATCC 10987]
MLRNLIRKTPHNKNYVAFFLLLDWNRICYKIIMG